MNSSNDGLRESRLGVDVGGTFTDVVAIGVDGAIHSLKLLSTPPDFSEGVVSGVRAIIEEHHLDPKTFRGVVHGNTVATNAILERKGALTGLLTTAGFADILELRRLRMPRLYDMTWEKPKPLVERYLRSELEERMDVNGNIVTPLDLGEVRKKVDALVAAGIESVAVSLIHSYANPVHERAIGDLLEREYPDLWVSLSCEVLPVIREYERTSTTVVNAYVQPTVASYLQSLREKLESSLIDGPLLIMQSNGGVMASDAAAQRPAYTIESGPAAGVIASAALATSLGINEVITFDMGGTTAKASLVEGGQPHFTAEFEVAAGLSAGSRLSSGGGYALSVPFIDLAEVGAGGGSIIWIDPAGAPKVGPASAGAVPGPVCYSKGGTDPTVTDANLILGYLNPAGLLNGELELDEAHARSVFEGRVASPLGLGVVEAAFGAHELANASMIRALKSVSVQRGRDPRDFTLVAFGGSGPVHAVGIARQLGIKRVIVPPRPGVFSAVGLLQARLETHAKKTYLRRTRDLTRNELDTQIAGLEAKARDGIGATSLEHSPFEFEAWAEMRYAGQAFELPVRLPAREIGWSDWLDQVEEEFGIQHERTYGHRTRNPTEVVHLVVIAREERPPTIPAERYVTSEEDPLADRDVFFGARFGLVRTPILRRSNLPSRPRRGPLVVEDYDATTVVPPDYSAHRDAGGNVVIESSS